MLPSAWCFPLLFQLFVHSKICSYINLPYLYFLSFQPPKKWVLVTFFRQNSDYCTILRSNFSISEQSRGFHDWFTKNYHGLILHQSPWHSKTCGPPFFYNDIWFRLKHPVLPLLVNHTSYFMRERLLLVLWEKGLFSLWCYWTPAVQCFWMKHHCSTCKVGFSICRWPHNINVEEGENLLPNTEIHFYAAVSLDVRPN